MRSWLVWVSFIFLFIVDAGRGAAAEPNVEVASEWWPELTNVVTPVAWRDHPHRFNVLYNGTILALPRPELVLRFEWGKGLPLEGVQLDFVPSTDGAIPPEPVAPYQLSLPGGSRVGDQGWADHAAPALWTRWRTAEGLVLRQTVFAHMAGGEEARTGSEPMFCWVRLEVAERAATATAEEFGFLVRIGAPHIRFDAIESNNCRILPDHAGYPEILRLEPLLETTSHASILEPDGRIRLVVLNEDNARLIAPGEGRRSHYLYVSTKAGVGSHIDLLLPMIPMDRETVEREIQLGYSGSLDQADVFWSSRPATAARIHTPESLINEAVEWIPKLARSISLTIPSTGQRSFLTGSMYYSFLWVTSASRLENWILDPLGWHEVAEDHIEILRENQGRSRPPGKDFPAHPGYFGVPEELDSGNHWLTDHGATLYTAARHALMTDDHAFIDRWTEPIVKGCEFIHEARRLPRQPPAVEGVMPAASATDLSDPIQAFWSDAWNYKGLKTAVRLLRRIDHPRADEFESEAADYREAILRAMRAKAARQPSWTDAQGRKRLITPMTVTADDRDGLAPNHPFFLDAGAMIAVWADLLPPQDELMLSAADFFREGPQTRAESSLEWRGAPRLTHEISSNEPCYSWNAFHNQVLGDRDRYLECMYSLLTGGISRQTYISCETRGGITENALSGTLAVCLLRLAVVDDAVELDRLHLMRLTPLAWMSEGEETLFENMPTEFGPVSLRWKMEDGGRTLRINYESHFHHAPQSVIFHAPPIPGLETITINQREYRASEAQIEFNN